MGELHDAARTLVRFAGRIALALALTPAIAPADGGLAGRWSGAIVFPNFELPIRVELSGGDRWSGSIDIPMQSAHGLALEALRIDGDTIAFEVPSGLGRARFEGRLSGAGEIDGTFTQADQERPFQLRRSDALPGGAARMTAAPSATELGGKTELTVDGDPVHGFAAFADSVRIAYEVPGCAVAIVRGEEAALVVGLGHRDEGEALPVTSQTLFAIGSATKPFTTFVLATLVDDGLLAWDTPVNEYLADFRMYDAVATARLTVRDLVSHRSGLPRHDLAWYGSSASREDLYRALRHLVPSRDIRETFQYQNLMFMTAGLLAGRVSGERWESLVRTRIFEPAGMSLANVSIAETESSTDHARPYAERDGEVIEVPFRDISAVGPAGSINASADDMARWLRVLIGGGAIDGRRLLSEAGVEDLFIPRTVIEQPALEPDEPLAAYASGWFVQPYRGHHRMHHGGNIDGFTSLVTLLPHEEIGVVVLANREASPLPAVVTRYAMDRLLDLDVRDWAGEGLVKLAAALAIDEAAEGEEDPTRAEGTDPSHRLEHYAGRYENPGYGMIEVSTDRGELQLVFHDMTTRLEHWHYDVFRARTDHVALDGVLFAFSTDPQGDVDAVSAPLESKVDPITFRRAPPSPLEDPALVDALVGEYVLGGQLVRVGRRGEDVLTLSVPGQPLYELQPYRGLEFRIKGVSGYRVRFGRDDDGPITEVVFIQPNGVFTASKR